MQVHNSRVCQNKSFAVNNTFDVIILNLASSVSVDISGKIGATVILLAQIIACDGNTSVMWFSKEARQVLYVHAIAYKCVGP